MMDTGQSILMLIFTLFTIAIIVIYCILVGVVIEKAQALGRSKFFWGFWAAINTPIIVLPLLFCAGETTDHRKRRVVDEEYERIKLWKTHFNPPNATIIKDTSRYGDDWGK